MTLIRVLLAMDAALVVATLIVNLQPHSLPAPIDMVPAAQVEVVPTKPGIQYEPTTGTQNTFFGYNAGRFVEQECSDGRTVSTASGTVCR